MAKVIALNDSSVFQIVSGLWKGKKGPFVSSKVLRSTNFRMNERGGR